MRIAALLAAGTLLATGPAEPIYPTITGPRPLSLPADQGAHPDHRTEWWYVTGWLTTGRGEALGFQVTFFRTRPGVAEGNPSAFAPTQVLFAHAALSDPALGRIRHAERSARAGFGIASARVGDIDVAVADWRLRRGADGTIRARAAGEDFALTLDLRPTQPPIAQGVAGYSRKGPSPDQASRYLSVPQLAVAGTIRRGGGGPERVTGTAWMDQEWSSDLLSPDAVGWDWTGLNGDDGSALMAFRIRRADGSSLWAGGGWRDRAGRFAALGPNDVRFRPLAWWVSPRTGGRYPVAQELTVRLPTGARRLTLTPLFADQELSGGVLPVYWEGAVRTKGGRGYLELTGYAGKLEM